ncbi:MAG: hypothetical protein ACM3SY_04310 [Candidatus Omnitrophota bacterium]
MADQDFSPEAFLFFFKALTVKEIGYIVSIQEVNVSMRDDIYQEVEKLPRNACLNEAINSENRRKILQKQLEMESKLIQKSSMEVLEDLEKIEDGMVE